MSTNFPRGDDEIKRLYLVRGLPGSGKTTFASHLPAELVEADDFFESKFGWNWYQFDKRFIQEAHDFCRAQTAYMIKERIWVAVANTFTTAKEMKPYFELAQRHGYEIVVYEMMGQFENIHDVPEAKIQQMRNRWESKIFPEWWKGDRRYIQMFPEEQKEAS